MIRRPPRSTRVRSSAASDVYKRQLRITVVSHELLDREVLVDAALAGQLAAMTSMDETERHQEPAYGRRMASVRDLALAKVDELRLAQQAREQVEARYLGGHLA